MAEVEGRSSNSSKHAASKHAASKHAVTVFTLVNGGCSAWCCCGDRFDSNAGKLAEAWARAHGTSVQFYPAAGHITAA